MSLLPKRPAVRRLAVLATLLATAPAWAQRTPAGPDDPAAARVIVQYKAQGALMKQPLAWRDGQRVPQHAATLALRHGLPLSDGFAIDGRTQVLHAQGLSSRQLAARLAADPEVDYAVPDERRRPLSVPNDPLYAGGAGVSPAAGQWYLRAPDAVRVSAINAVGAWNWTVGSAAIVVAVLDTGVRFEHPDLTQVLVPGYDFVADPGDARDGNGRDADASDPGDWSTAGQCGAGESAAASSWHGTKMAGLVGAQTDNGIGMASVGRGVRVQPVRVLGPCGGYDSDIIAGMLWAGGLTSVPVANPTPARVINLSLGSAGACSAAYRDAVSRLVTAGVVVVAAAGNEEGLAVGTPANCPGVIAVAAVRHAGSKVGFSSIGPEVSISAPGGNCVNLTGECVYPILTTSNAGTQGPGASTYTTGADYSVGTSFATPLVAGVAALMLSANPSLTPAQLRSRLQATARAFPTTVADPSVPQCRAPDGVAQIECLCTTTTCGAGMLDAEAAVRAAAASLAPSVSLVVSASSVTAGTTVELDGSATQVPVGRSVASWRWAITGGTGIAAFTGDTSGPRVQLRTSGAGTVTVQLTVTDSVGAQDSRTATVTVTASTGGGTTASGGGGAGGGALTGTGGAGWLLGLLLAAWGLWRWPERGRQ